MPRPQQQHAAQHRRHRLRHVSQLRPDDGPGAAGSLGLGAFLVDEWLPAVRPPWVRPSTWASYRMAVERHIVPTLGGVLLAGPTSDGWRVDCRLPLEAA